MDRQDQAAVERNRKAVALAEAAKLDLDAAYANYKAAVLRDDLTAAAEVRAKAHDLVDAILDQHGTMALALKSIIG